MLPPADPMVNVLSSPVALISSCFHSYLTEFEVALVEALTIETIDDPIGPRPVLIASVRRSCTAWPIVGFTFSVGTS